MRRDYGEGSIRLRADGRWEARISLGSVDGRRKRKFLFARSRRQVLLKLQEELRRRAHGKAESSMRLRDFLLERWLPDVVEPNKRPRTQYEYRGHVRRYLVPGLGHIPLNRLEPAEVQRFLNRIRREVGASSAWHCRKDLMAALNQAIRWRLLQENVVRLTEPVRVPDREPTVFDREQCLRFLAALRGELLGPIFVISLTSGLRPNEVLALRWSDLDLEAGTVHVRRSLEPDRSVGPTKSHRSKRPLPLSTVAIAMLRALPSRPGVLVFSTRKGTAYDSNNVARAFRRILREAELPDIRFYDLRHSFATLLESEHVPVKTLQELMGHARAETTLRYYTHGSMAANREAITVLDRLLLTPGLTDDQPVDGFASVRIPADRAATGRHRAAKAPSKH